MAADHERAWAEGLAQEQAHQQELLATFRGELAAFARECAAALTALDTVAGGVGDLAQVLTTAQKSQQHAKLVLDIHRRVAKLRPSQEDAELVESFAAPGDLPGKVVQHARETLKKEPTRSDRELLQAIANAAGARAQIEGVLGPAPIAALAALAPLGKHIPRLTSAEEQEAQASRKELTGALNAAATGVADAGGVVEVSAATSLARLDARGGRPRERLGPRGRAGPNRRGDRAGPPSARAGPGRPEERPARLAGRLALPARPRARGARRGGAREARAPGADPRLAAGARAAAAADRPRPEHGEPDRERRGPLHRAPRGRRRGGPALDPARARDDLEAAPLPRPRRGGPRASGAGAREGRPAEADTRRRRSRPRWPRPASRSASPSAAVAARARPTQPPSQSSTGSTAGSTSSTSSTASTGTETGATTTEPHDRAEDHADQGCFRPGAEVDALLVLAAQADATRGQVAVGPAAAEERQDLLPLPGRCGPGEQHVVAPRGHRRLPPLRRPAHRHGLPHGHDGELDLQRHLLRHPHRQGQAARLCYAKA